MVPPRAPTPSAEAKQARWLGCARALTVSLTRIIRLSSCLVVLVRECSRSGRRRVPNDFNAGESPRAAPVVVGQQTHSPRLRTGFSLPHPTSTDDPNDTSTAA